MGKKLKCPITNCEDMLDINCNFSTHLEDHEKRGEIISPEMKGVYQEIWLAMVDEYKKKSKAANGGWEVRKAKKALADLARAAEYYFSRGGKSEEKKQQERNIEEKVTEAGGSKKLENGDGGPPQIPPTNQKDVQKSIWKRKAPNILKLFSECKDLVERIKEKARELENEYLNSEAEGLEKNIKWIEDNSVKYRWSYEAIETNLKRLKKEAQYLLHYGKRRPTLKEKIFKLFLTGIREWMGAVLLVLGLFLVIFNWFGGWFFGLPLIVVGLIFLPWGKILGAIGKGRPIVGHAAKASIIGAFIFVVLRFLPWAGIEVNLYFFLLLGVINSGLLLLLWHISEKKLEDIMKEYYEWKMRGMKESLRRMRGQSAIEAVIAGFLIALSAFLFVEYFGVVGGIKGLAAVNLILLLIGAVVRLHGVLILVVILLVLGYAAYGPYAEYLRGPMGDIRESMRTLPGMVEQQMHCLALLMTNPMQYTKECAIKDQPRAPEEKPENYGFELTNFQTLPQKDIYAGMPLQIQAIFENKGDYDATKVTIEPTAGKYSVCEERVLTIEGVPSKEIEEIKSGKTYYYRFKGKIRDPWSEEVDCPYAKNKAFIGGKIKLKYEYDYQTESFIDNMEAIRSTEKEEPQFRLVSAKEKAAPANVLMFTFSPLIREDEGFSESNIPISFKNERKEGKIIFRGEYGQDSVVLPKDSINEEEWCKEVCWEEEDCIEACKSSCINDCTSNFSKISEVYDHCWVVDSSDNEIDRLEGIGEGECNDEVIKFEYNNECWATKDGEKIEKIPVKDECDSLTVTPYYKVTGKYKRSNYDNITVYIVGEEGKKWVDLSCGKSNDVVECKKIKKGEIELIWKKNDLEIKPGEDRFVYSDIVVSLVGFPKDVDKFNFGIKADATYRVEMERRQELTIHNPHYTD